MVINWLEFIPALGLLLTPIGLFHGRKIRYRSINRDWDRHWPQILRLGLHTVDFIRAALGTWLLLDALSVPPDARGLAKYSPLITQGVIRVLAVWLQTIVCKQPEAVNAPFAFVVGLLLTGASPLVATIAFALTLPLVLGARAPMAFFPIFALTFVLTGAIFGGKALMLKISPGAFAVIVPWMWALLFRCQLVISYRLKRAEEVRPSEALR